MKTLNNYILDLLILHDCVIIPELGGFITDYKPAKVKNKNKISAPCKLVAFNPQLKTNDGLLANHIARSESISYEMAMAKISSFVSRVNKGIKANGIYLLPHIGRLKKGRLQKLSFEPSKTATFLPLELKDIKLAPIVRQEIAKVSTRTIESKANPIQKWMVASVILVAILGIFLNQDNLSDKAPVTYASIAPSILTTTDNTINEPSKANNTNIESTQTEDVEVKMYHVVVGCFSSKENAQKQQALFEAMNYKTHIFTKGKLTGVTVGSFSSFINAKKLMDELRDSKLANAWVLKKEL